MTTNGGRRAGWRGFGVAGALPHDVIRTLAAAAEAAGYHTFWVNDTPNGDGLAALRAAVEVTSQIQLGVGVIPLDRQPADVIARRVDENMCALAGSGSDGVLLNWLTAEYVAPSAAIVTAAARDAGRLRPLILGYVRTAFGPGAREVFAEEAGRYGGYPAYAANFARMGTPAEATAVIGDTSAEIQAGLASFTSELDETVVRAITGEESADAYMALLEAAAPE
jgi:alkanesulfonate monooxygenase SsuD/methylene tetrahydromethanopterin reductase-like flavin-dependent oxidoreductase (luciferase family)